MAQVLPRGVRAALLLLAVATITTGCTSTPVSQQEITGPTPVEPWGEMASLARDGSVYFASQPSADGFREAEGLGIATVVNLRSDAELATLPFNEVATIDALDMDYVSIPVSPETFSVEDVDRLAEVLEETDEPVLIHCSSSNRVGGLWAAYLHRYRFVPLEEAMEAGRAAGLRSEAMIEATRRVSEAP